MGDSALAAEHRDVLIVGGGLSGIGAACYLQRHCPAKSYAILEARADLGGTWDLFRYPGIRSDSDMFTLGYSFRPWEQAEAIAAGPSILQYLRDTAHEHGVEEKIRFGHRVLSAEWSSADCSWTVQAERSNTGEQATLTCGFLYVCTGYYRYDQGYTPHLEGVERFGGEVIHPQHWPENLDYAGKQVVVIGSGATAVTLVPAMAERAAHVTMLQRSPSYIVSLPGRDSLASALQRRLPSKLAYSLVRLKNVLMMIASYQLSRRAPKLTRRLVRSGVEKRLPAGYDVEAHFNPRYDPWDQRLCLAPDGDLFEAISDGRASIVTDTIETFTETGLRLASGRALDADVIVTATGLNLLALGEIALTVDGNEVDIASTVAYKGMMLSGVPNLALTFGYSNASWTLRADLIAGYVCRLLNYMDQRGYSICRPRGPDPALPRRPFLDLTSGFVLRSIDLLPKQGVQAPWRVRHNYLLELRLLQRGPVDDSMDFSSPANPSVAGAQPDVIANASIRPASIRA